MSKAEDMADQVSSSFTPNYVLFFMFSVHLFNCCHCMSNVMFTPVGITVHRANSHRQ